ncbi:ABC transporter substrate-binding protein [Paenibacillus sp. P46E]|uniref:ABC transporter substrate-binding protein n=1 Tax=Paenibacillus sp. P46E TaxID=1349436 RepID=UPI00093DFB40|nr:ABC transporter substrate-binding protein [Paenibacillus sp. P46E]OKP99772.1 ABC transporter substrate-binding protein [Paenibacillus sp. P46E]
MLTAPLFFLELRGAAEERSIGEAFPITVEKLTGIWHCTPRYAKQVIRKLCGEGWISWQSGLGRGHTSILTLLADADSILLREVKRRMEQGDVREALALMNRFGGQAAKEQFRDWLSERIGFSTQAVEDSLLDTLQFPVYRQIFTLDPGLVYYAFDCHMAGQLFNTLVEYEQASRKVVPCIAHSWECSADAREWTFYLRKGVLFHHGRELNAGDAVFSLNRLRLHPDTYEAAWMFQDIEELEAVNTTTVRIRLRETNYLFLRFLCTIAASIVPAEIAGNPEADFTVHPVGTGPFRIGLHNEGICILEAFGQHFQGRPQLERVEVLNFSGLEAGYFSEPDWTSVMSSHGDASRKHLKVLEDGEGEWLDVETRFSCCNLLVFNQDKSGPQNHPKFREALDALIDREQMISELGEDRIYPAHGFRYEPGEQEWRVGSGSALDRAGIKVLLESSGYRGEMFRLAVGSFHRQDAVWIQERARSFGIQMEIDVIDRLEEGDNVYASTEHDVRLFGSVLGDDEISEIQMYMQKNYLQAAFDPVTAKIVHQTVNAVFRERDEKLREQQLAELEAYIRTTRSILFLVHKKNNTSHHKAVRGVSINAYGWPEFHKLWFHPHSTKKGIAKQ